MALGAVLGLAGAASAQDDGPAAPPVDVIEVSGLLDAPLLDFIERSIQRAETDGSQALVLQMDSTGAVVDDEQVAALADRMRSASVPVTIWVGPSGSRAYGASGQLLGAAAVTGMAPGSRIGRFGPPLPTQEPLTFGQATAYLRNFTLGAEEARNQGALKLGVDDRGTPTLGDFVVVLDGFEYRGEALDTAEVVERDGQVRRQLVIQPRSYKLDLLPRLLHTVASPPVTYLLLAIGLGLLVFEFFTAGIGVAGVVGAFCLVLGSYGVAALPTRWWSLLLLFLAFVAFSIDVQTGVPRFWTGVGVALFVISSFTLFEGHPLSWITLLVAFAGVLLTYFSGMPSMVRTRFATPTIGREWMIGRVGEVAIAVDPEGVVELDGAQWRARTNRATPIGKGGRVRVVAIDGVTLEVEPEAGGARDYRDRSRSAPTPPTAP
jgi:membrane-bound serine protease (ClpP class)